MNYQECGSKITVKVKNALFENIAALILVIFVFLIHGPELREFAQN